MSNPFIISEELCLELSDWDIIQLLSDLGVDKETLQKEFGKCRDIKFKAEDHQETQQEKNSGLLDEEILDTMADLQENLGLWN